MDELFQPLQALSLNDVEVTGKEIGRGAYGVVLEVKVSGLSCAGKKLHDAITEEYLVKKFIDECLNHSQLRHPNIVQLMGVYFPPDSDTPILVMERLQVSLAQCLDEAPLPLSVKYNILLDVANGLNYLHHKTPPIIHRDLTAQNILLTESFNAKISDLGVSKRIYLTKSRSQTVVPGNAAVMPPEAFTDQLVYDHKLDVFSYGSLILHTFTQDLPIPVSQLPQDPLNEWQRRFVHIAKMGANHPMLPIARNCLQNDPACRPAMGYIVRVIQAIAYTSSDDDASSGVEIGHLYDEIIGNQSESNDYVDLDGTVTGLKVKECSENQGKKNKEEFALFKQAALQGESINPGSPLVRKRSGSQLNKKTKFITASNILPQDKRPQSSIAKFTVEKKLPPFTVEKKPPPLPPRVKTSKSSPTNSAASPTSSPTVGELFTRSLNYLSESPKDKRFQFGAPPLHNKIQPPLMPRRSSPIESSLRMPLPDSPSSVRELKHKIPINLMPSPKSFLRSKQKPQQKDSARPFNTPPPRLKYFESYAITPPHDMPICITPPLDRKFEFSPPAMRKRLYNIYSTNPRKSESFSLQHALTSSGEHSGMPVLNFTTAKSALMAKEKKNGNYLLWCNSVGEHYLSVYFERIVTHIRISRDAHRLVSLDKSFCAEKKSFASFDELVNYYKRVPLYFKEGITELK